MMMGGGRWEPPRWQIWQLFFLLAQQLVKSQLLLGFRTIRTKEVPHLWYCLPIPLLQLSHTSFPPLHTHKHFLHTPPPPHLPHTPQILADFSLKVLQALQGTCSLWCMGVMSTWQLLCDAWVAFVMVLVHGLTLMCQVSEPGSQTEGQMEGITCVERGAAGHQQACGA